MVINTKMFAQIEANNPPNSSAMLSKSLARLSSGSKIVDHSDDPAGPAGASRLDAQVQRLTAAKVNVSNAISFAQTQDGYLKKVAKALYRMSELAILSQDVTKSNGDRSLYDSEFSQLSSQVTDAAVKNFNGVSLFSTTNLNVTIDSEGNTFTMNGINLSSSTYTTATNSGVSTVSAAAIALRDVKSAITQLSTDRATIGAYQSRLNFTVEQLTVSRENLMAASSRIQHVDVAEESTDYPRQNILAQSGTAMLAQANSLPQRVLRLQQ